MAKQVTDIGNTVICDVCGSDFTDSPASGGLLFQSKAACPTCAPGIEASAREHGETRFIHSRCPAGMSFAAWCLELRGGDNTIQVLTGSDADEMFDRLKPPNPPAADGG